MSCADSSWNIGLLHEKAPETSLEAYANAVHLYQSIVLELQAIESQDAAVRRDVLERAAEAKAIVNQYRSASRAAGSGM